MHCIESICAKGYLRCKDELYCRPQHLMCDWKTHCRHSSDEDPNICAQMNCSEGHWGCTDGLQCIPETWVCDGNPGSVQNCLDESDEDPATCSKWKCSTGLGMTWECENIEECDFTKCAEDLQCVKRRSICDGKFDCKDRSDELCDDNCHTAPLKPEEKDIVKICQEDSSRCVSVKQYCDGIAQCPDASDETQQGCGCEPAHSPKILAYTYL